MSYFTRQGISFKIMGRLVE